MKRPANGPGTRLRVTRLAQRRGFSLAGWGYGRGVERRATGSQRFLGIGWRDSGPKRCRTTLPESCDDPYLPSTGLARVFATSGTRAPAKVGHRAGTSQAGASSGRVHALAGLWGESGPVREALSQLHKEGLVVLERRDATMVTRLSREDFEELYELRFGVEKLAVKRAARLISVEVLAGMESAVVAHGEAGVTPTRKVGT